MVKIVEELEMRGVEVRSKADSDLMRLIGFLLGLVGIKHFMDRFWTTVGPSVIYAPTTADLSKLGIYELTIRHELVHISQARRWPVLWQISYLLLPVPAVFAWFRWRWEREAYLVQLKAGVTSIDAVVDTLWSVYWCWPRPWMRRWFKRKV